MDPKNPFWPQYDMDAMARYGGKWVVVVNGKIVDDDENPQAVRERVARDYDLPLKSVFAVAVCKPEEARL